MKILAFDLGRLTGVAFGDSRSHPICHTETLGETGDSQDARFCQCLRMTHRLIDTYKPNVVVIEKPIAGGVVGSEARVQYAMGFRGCIFGVAKMKRIRTAEYSVGEIRKYILDHGNLPASKAKPAVFSACQLMGWPVTNFEESDAAAVWHLARARLANVTVMKGLFGNEQHIPR